MTGLLSEFCRTIITQYLYLPAEKNIHRDIHFRSLYPVFFLSCLNKSLLFKKLNAFTVICQNIAVQLMKLQSFKTIFYQAGQSH